MSTQRYPVSQSATVPILVPEAERETLQQLLSIEMIGEEWEYDAEAEFFADYRLDRKSVV
jgi:hypothetical protein